MTRFYRGGVKWSEFQTMTWDERQTLYRFMIDTQSRDSG